MYKELIEIFVTEIRAGLRQKGVNGYTLCDLAIHSIGHRIFLSLSVDGPKVVIDFRDNGVTMQTTSLRLLTGNYEYDECAPPRFYYLDLHQIDVVALINFVVDCMMATDGIFAGPGVFCQDHRFAGSY